MSLNIILYFIIKLLWNFFREKKDTLANFSQKQYQRNLQVSILEKYYSSRLNIHLSSAYIIKYNSNIAANLPAQCKWKVSKRKITLNFFQI